MRSAASVVLVLLLAVPPRAGAAQCDGRTISAISVTSHRPSFVHVPRPLRPLARGMGLEHTTTRPAVVRSFLLLAVGRPCSATQVAESQRILRLQPFLAEATVRAVPDSTGGVRIEVETLDEIPAIFSMRFRGWTPAAIRVGEGNVGGQGLLIAGRFQHRLGYRSGVGLEVVTYQALGRPYTLALEAYRAPLGSTLRVAFGHAFFTDLQRTAWHIGYSNINAYTSFVRPDTDGVSLGVVRRFADIGSVLRVGFGRRIGFVGGLITYERVTAAAQPVVITDSGLVADTSTPPPIGGPFPRYENVRLNAVVGVRSLSFLEVRGFDALAAVQDVARGVQFGVVVGRGNDTFVSADLYAGAGSRRVFTALRVEAEARHGRGGGGGGGGGANRWDSMVASGRLALYWKPSDAHVVVASNEFSGGWRMRIPFQLALGTVPGGVRGYHDSRVVGAVRNVTRLEDRWSLGRITRHVGVGLGTFADAGLVWAGDAPYGVRSGVKAGVGAGLFVTVPPQSKRLWRLDVAFPISADAHARWEVRLTTVWVGGFWSEPRDIAQVRAGAAPSLIFTWP